MKKPFLILLFCAVTFAVSAQKNDTLVRNIQIERDYVPEVAPAIRPDVPLTITEPNIDKSNTTFSQFSQPFDVEKGEFIPISPQNLTSINREKAKPGFLRIGAGVLCAWLADLYYPVWDTKDGFFDIALHHDGIYGISKKPMSNKKLFNTDLGINFKKNFGVHQFYLGAKYENEAFNYYGNDTLLSNHYLYNWDSIFYTNQSFNRANFTLGMRSNKRTDSGWLYDAYLNYHLFAASKETKIAEHNINAAVRADVLINEKHNIDVELGVQTYFYTPKDSVNWVGTPYYMEQDYMEQGYMEQDWKPNIIIRLLPAYLLNTKKIHLRLGIKTYFNFGKKNEGKLGDVFAVTPDIKLDYFYKDLLNLYAGVTGHYNINSLQNMTAENRYFAIWQATEQHAYIPLDIFAGFKVKITKGLLFDAFLNYQPFMKGKMFFENSHLLAAPEEYVFYPYFFAIESGYSLFSAGVRLNYNIKEQINIFAQMKYNGWNLNENDNSIWGYAFHTPAFQINAGSEFKIGKKFFGSVNFYFASKPEALRSLSGSHNFETITLPATFDLNLGFGYNIKKNISLFVQANNVLALAPKLNYQTWYGYNSMGAHLLLGATINF